MKQIIQDLNSPVPEIIEIPIPDIGPNEILIKTSLSLISTGTEKMIIDFAKSNIYEKALSQPEKVSQLISKISNDGIFSAYESVQSKLGKPIPLGYSNVGKIIKVGSQVNNFKIGDRVISNGGHAEYVCVSKSLCCLVPNTVSDKDAVFTVLSSIALQGIRLLNPTFGEKIVVSGLGVIGLLTVQILLANGVIVYAIDPEENRCKIASKFGADVFHLKKDSNPEKFFNYKTLNNGVDGVILTCATKSSSPLNLASNICRQRGRIILVGTCDINIKRELFYKKELNFQVSCSYGPGRYNKSYENDCNDFPFGFVRWTENRNFDAILSSIKRGIFKPAKLISHTFDFESYESAYKLISSDINCLGIILDYKPNNEIKNNNGKEIIEISSKVNNLKKTIYSDNKAKQRFNPSLGFIGAGNFASRFLIPSFNKNKIILNTICANSGLNSHSIYKKFNFLNITTNPNDIFDSDEIDTLVIATRHDSHCEYILKGLEKGKNIYVEKPLCLTLDELNRIKKCFLEMQKISSNNILMVGYNRRFSPLVTKLKKYLDEIHEPKSFVFLCNSGYINPEHWVQEKLIGGGRIIGEACHFIDLIRYLASSKIEKLSIDYLKGTLNRDSDSSTIQINFENGSTGTVHYLSNGSSLFPKERLEVFSESKTFRIDNFKTLKAWGQKGFRKKTLFKQDKGVDNSAKEFINSIKLGKVSPIPISEIFEVQEMILQAL